jgi:hypothetical protein
MHVIAFVSPVPVQKLGHSPFGVSPAIHVLMYGERTTRGAAGGRPVHAVCTGIVASEVAPSRSGPESGLLTVASVPPSAVETGGPPESTMGGLPASSLGE